VERRGDGLRGVRIVSTETELEAAGRMHRDRSLLAVVEDVPLNAWRARVALRRLDLQQGDERWRFWQPDLILTRDLPGKSYLGLRLVKERKEALVAPVAGIEVPAGGVRFWAASLPELVPSGIEVNWVREGDWQVPDLSLPPLRRWLDLRGGVRWEGPGGGFLQAAAFAYRAEGFRTWTADGGVWRETRRDGVQGGEVTVRGRWRWAGGVRVDGEVSRLWARDEEGRVPFVPRYRLRLRLAYETEPWTAEAGLWGRWGTVDEADRGFGTFLRVDLGVTYRWRPGLEYSLRIENVTGAGVRRWPGFPAYGRAVYGGLRFRVAG
jgi:hypothetical protein